MQEQLSQLERELDRSVERQMGAPGIEPGKGLSYVLDCQRCGYAIDDDGYCFMCGATTLKQLAPEPAHV